jgi:hypothetical protein
VHPEAVSVLLMILDLRYARSFAATQVNTNKSSIFEIILDYTKKEGMKEGVIQLVHTIIRNNQEVKAQSPPI